MASITEIREGFARVLLGTLSWRQVEDFEELQEGPSVQVEACFEVRWDGDRNANTRVDNAAHAAELEHRVTVRLGRQALPGRDSQGVPLRRKVLKDLEETARGKCIRALMSRESEFLGELRIAYVGSAHVNTPLRDWVFLDVRFTVRADEPLGEAL